MTAHDLQPAHLLARPGEVNQASIAPLVSVLPRTVSDPLGPCGQPLEASTEHRLLWHIVGQLFVHTTQPHLVELAIRLRAYLSANCQHHWHHYSSSTEGEMPDHDHACGAATSTSTPAGPPSAMARQPDMRETSSWVCTAETDASLPAAPRLRLPTAAPCKPAIPFHGGKSRMAAEIVSLFPPHQVCVEPFAGSAAVILAKPPATHEILNDVDSLLVNFYRVLRERPEELEYACRLTPYAREEFTRADLTEDGLTDVKRARRYWVRLSQSFAHTASDQTGWSTSIRRGSNNARTAWNRIERFRDIADRLSTVTLEHRDALECITAYDVDGGVIYADPPYLLTSRSGSGLRRPAGDYRHEFTSERDHRDLAEVLHQCQSTVVLSGYASPLYDELYPDWHHTTYRVLRRTSNGRSGVQTHVTEHLWSNRRLAAGTLDFAT